eukprot:3764641-Rhodomonas_salina.2
MSALHCTARRLDRAPISRDRATIARGFCSDGAGSQTTISCFHLGRGGYAFVPFSTSPYSLLQQDGETQSHLSKIKTAKSHGPSIAKMLTRVRAPLVPPPQLPPAASSAFVPSFRVGCALRSGMSRSCTSGTVTEQHGDGEESSPALYTVHVDELLSFECAFGEMHFMCTGLGCGGPWYPTDGAGIAPWPTTLAS